MIESNVCLFPSLPGLRGTHLHWEVNLSQKRGQISEGPLEARTLFTPWSYDKYPSVEERVVVRRTVWDRQRDRALLKARRVVVYPHVAFDYFQVSRRSLEGINQSIDEVNRAFRSLSLSGPVVQDSPLLEEPATGPKRRIISVSFQRWVVQKTFAGPVELHFQDFHIRHFSTRFNAAWESLRNELGRACDERRRVAARANYDVPIRRYARAVAAGDAA